MNCPICHSEIAPLQIEYRNIGKHANRIFDNLSISTCPDCGSGWVDEPPSTDQIASYYTADYSPARMINIQSESGWPFWDDRAASLIMLGRLFSEFRPQDLFVDVGPGNGAALSVAPYLLPRPRLACIEYNDSSIKFFKEKLPGIIISNSLKEILDAEGERSIRFLFSAHCFEHFNVQDFLIELATIRRGLVKGGVAIIEVPFAPASKIVHVLSHAPHLIFFSPKGLSRVLRTAGFDVQLCINTWGRTKSGNRYVSENLPKPDSSTSAGFRQKVSAWNSPDLIKKSGAPVLKAVVRNPD